ncbi:MAG: glutamate-cysteine ligase family protein [Desulfobacteraceae bacterium]
MPENNSPEVLTEKFTRLLGDYIQGRMPAGKRTFGFEYEFMPDRILDLSDMKELYSFLQKEGFEFDGGAFVNKRGSAITFEPGGQIEYHSVPLLYDDLHGCRECLEIIRTMNEKIEKSLGIKYVATAWIPGRESAPLCLESERYVNLHDRLTMIGKRGREMMKGTASIHLHVVIRRMEEIVPLFLKLKELAFSDEFGMSPQRRKIWDETDPCRCGFPFGPVERTDSPDRVIKEFVSVAVHADVLGEDIPFYKVSDTSFDNFLYHFTTIFTDIRLNAKGPTLELRTPDSVPFDRFETIWHDFIKSVNVV